MIVGSVDVSKIAELSHCATAIAAIDTLQGTAHERQRPQASPVAHKRHRLVRRGRPRKANAGRRATLIAGREPFLDLGSPELQRRKRAVANDSAVTPELIDVAGALLCHNLITPEQLLLLRLLSAWLHRVRAAFGIPAASPSALWSAITTRQRVGQWAPRQQPQRRRSRAVPTGGAI
jgi:hypothetical protein